MSKRTLAMRAAAEYLKKQPNTCTEVGAHLWARGLRKPVAYARPAGRLLHHMKRLGVVEQRFDGRHFFLWHLKPNWKAMLDSIKD